MLTIDDVEERQRQFEHIRSKWLTERGWKNTSAHPDCRWRWQLEKDGKTYCMDVERAMDFQADLEREQ